MICTAVPLKETALLKGLEIPWARSLVRFGTHKGIAFRGMIDWFCWCPWAFWGRLIVGLFFFGFLYCWAFVGLLGFLSLFGTYWAVVSCIP